MTAGGDLAPVRGQDDRVTHSPGRTPTGDGRRWAGIILRVARNETSQSCWYPPNSREFETIPLVFVWSCRRWLIQSAVRSDVTRPLDAAAAGDRQAAAD